MKILKKIWASFEYVGRVRAAQIMVRNGDRTGAIALMSKI